MDVLLPVGVIFLAVLFALLLLTRTVVIVKQASTAIVERLGRYQRTLSPGLSILVPVIDRIRERVDMREQVASFPPQPVITEDNLVVSIDTVIYFQVTDPKAATYEISSFILGIEQLTVTTLRNVIGSMDLEEALTSRDQINGQLRGVLDEATGKWGIRVNRVELKAIDPPKSVQEAMEKQLKAERERRAAILTAEGQKQAAILTAEGARQSAILSAEGEAQAAVLRAEGEAKARVIAAEAEANAVDPDLPGPAHRRSAAERAGAPLPAGAARGGQGRREQGVGDPGRAERGDRADQGRDERANPLTASRRATGLSAGCSSTNRCTAGASQRRHVAQGPADRLGDEELAVGGEPVAHGEQPVEIGALLEPALVLDRRPDRASGRRSRATPT